MDLIALGPYAARSSVGLHDAAYLPSDCDLKGRHVDTGKRFFNAEVKCKFFLDCL